MGSPDSSILLIEDTPSLQMIYAAVLRKAGYEVTSAGTAAEGTKLFRETAPKVVLLDLMLPDRDGLDLMQDMLADAPETCVIVITANGSINKAVDAMRGGAHEFLVKPFDETRLASAVENAFRLVRSRPHLQPVPDAPQADQALPPFIGSSDVMQDVYRKIRSVSRSMATVFITGESGTGKELCAEAVHRISDRASGPLIALNCGAIPVDLLESEVFGHLKGSFTGAISDKPGAAAAADGGTLFLDEICEMDLNLQTKLLRFLQTSTITPVGATRPRKVSVRIVCATNRDPLDAVRKGIFREDLYYRLHVVPIHMPPLRARGNDVIQIAESILTDMACEEGHDFTGLDPAVVDRFLSLQWPGNVRQLINVLRNVVVLNRGPLVTTPMLPHDIAQPTSRYTSDPMDEPAPVPHAAAAAVQVLESAPGDPLDIFAGKTLAEIERIIIEATVERHQGSVPRAARELSVSPSTLYRKFDVWNKIQHSAE